MFWSGNPLLGPTGEDPLKIYIEDLINTSLKARDGYKYNSTPLEVYFIFILIFNVVDTIHALDNYRNSSANTCAWKLYRAKSYLQKL